MCISLQGGFGIWHIPSEKQDHVSESAWECGELVLYQWVGFRVGVRGINLKCT
jgi:hypothetical protein